MVQLCEICGERPSVGRCRICGREVCEEHLVNGVCSVCRDLLIPFKGSLKAPVGRCPFCGRLICRECSVELEPGIRVCLDCYRKLPQYLSKYPELKGCYGKYVRR